MTASRRALIWLSAALIGWLAVAYRARVDDRRRLLVEAERLVALLEQVAVPSPSGPPPSAAPTPPPTRERIAARLDIHPLVTGLRALLAQVSGLPSSRAHDIVSRVAAVAQRWDRRRASAEWGALAYRLDTTPAIAALDGQTPETRLQNAVDDLSALGQSAEARALIEAYRARVVERVGKLGALNCDWWAMDVLLAQSRIREARAILVRMADERLAWNFNLDRNAEKLWYAFGFDAGELESSAAWYQARRGKPDRGLAALTVIDRITLGEVLVALGRVSEARALVKDTLSVLEPGTREEFLPRRWFVFLTQLAHAENDGPERQQQVAGLLALLKKQPYMLSGAAGTRMAYHVWDALPAARAAGMDRQLEPLVESWAAAVWSREGACGAWALLAVALARTLAPRDPERALGLLDAARVALADPGNGRLDDQLREAQARAEALAAAHRPQEARAVLAAANDIGRPDIGDGAILRREAAAFARTLR